MAFQNPETYPAVATYPAAASFPSGSAFPSAYDPDAVIYFVAYGVTDPTERLNISQFITGLKSNGIWNSLVWGGTFRSTQSIGSGTAVPSLNGGPNATAENSISWGTTGINLTSVSSRILGGTSLTPVKSAWTMILVTSASVGATDGYYAKYDRAGWYNNSSATSAGVVDIGDATITTPPYLTVSSTDFKMLTVTAGPYPAAATVFASLNAGAQITGTRAFAASAGDAFVLSGGSAGAGAEKTVTGIYASHFFFNNTLSASKISDFYTMYKNTIGQGLSLP